MNKKQREQSNIECVQTQITLQYPRCQGLNIKKNGFNSNRKQKYYCKICKRCFIGAHALDNKGCYSQSYSMIWRMNAYGNGIGAICAITGYSRDKVQAALKRSQHHITPKQKHYETLQLDELNTFVGSKKNKVWLIYAYHAKTGEIVAFVWGKRDLQTALALKQRLKELKVSYNRITSDDWGAFVNAFSDANEQWIGKQYIQTIEGNNCRIRHKLSRAIRRSCCFSKSMSYHIKSFNIGFWAINYPKQI